MRSIENAEMESGMTRQHNRIRRTIYEQYERN